MFAKACSTKQAKVERNRTEFSGRQKCPLKLSHCNFFQHKKLEVLFEERDLFCEDRSVQNVRQSLLYKTSQGRTKSNGVQWSPKMPLKTFTLQFLSAQEIRSPIQGTRFILRRPIRAKCSPKLALQNKPRLNEIERSSVVAKNAP